MVDAKLSTGTPLRAGIRRCWDSRSRRTLEASSNISDRVLFRWETNFLWCIKQVAITRSMLYVMSLLLGIIGLRLRGPPHIPPSSYQLDISFLNTLLDVSPSQHPDVTSVQLHCSCSLFSLHLYLSSVPQYTTEGCVVLVWLIDHTNSSCGIVQLPQACGKRRKECSVVM